MTDAAREELPFTVELWSRDFEHLEETVARLADFLTAKAAYEALISADRVSRSWWQGARVVLKLLRR